MLFYFVQCWFPEDFGGVHLSLCVLGARIRVLKNSLLCCEKFGMEYYLQLIFHFCISFLMFFSLGACLLCSLFQNSIDILRFFFYELFSMVFPVLEEMQQKLGSQILHIGLTKIFSRLSLYHPHCQELMMMKSVGSYGRLSMLFVLQVMV
jgi:hypothetical protein